MKYNKFIHEYLHNFFMMLIWSSILTLVFSVPILLIIGLVAGNMKYIMSTIVLALGSVPVGFLGIFGAMFTNRQGE